jgi:hypothetical protein
MSNGVLRRVVPAHLPLTRYKAEIPIQADDQTPGGPDIPFVDKNDPAHKQFREKWVAKCKVFDLSNEAQLAEYEKIWQLVADQAGAVCESKTEFNAEKGTFLAFIRWAEFTILPPAGSR